MQQKEAPNMRAVKLVNWGVGAVRDVDIWYGINATEDLDSILLKSMAPILMETSGMTMTDPFVQCCRYGFRETAMEILRSGQVSLDGMDPIIVLGLLEKCSITADVLPEGPFREKMMRAQKVRRVFGK